ncbi:MAG: ABC transporter substrate-binding protein, partial [Anaerolineales bacterium]
MNKKSQHWTLLAVLLVLSLLLAACGAAPAQAETIKIGAALCLTGIQAPLDEPALKGAQLAVEELNKKGGVLGKQLELINLDCKSDPVTTGNVAVQLIEQGA